MHLPNAVAELAERRRMTESAKPKYDLSLELLAKLVLAGENQEKILSRIDPESTVNLRGQIVDARSVAKGFMQGPDELGRILMTTQAGKKLRAILERKKGTEWLPQELPGNYAGGVIQRIRLLTPPGQDPGEGDNMRDIGICLFDKAVTAAFWLYLVLKHGQETVLGQCGLHCGQIVGFKVPQPK